MENNVFQSLINNPLNVDHVHQDILLMENFAVNRSTRANPIRVILEWTVVRIMDRSLVELVLVE